MNNCFGHQQCMLRMLPDTQQTAKHILWGSVVIFSLARWPCKKNCYQRQNKHRIIGLKCAILMVMKWAVLLGCWGGRVWSMFVCLLLWWCSPIYRHNILATPTNTTYRYLLCSLHERFITNHILWRHWSF